MIYLIQDCYEDQEGNFHRILKIGYSSKTFDEGRKSQYDTHNYGYKLLSEREGSQELERYLHRRLQEYHLSLEWFKYDSEVIKIFNEVSEEDISQFKSQEELNEYIREYILENLIPSVKDLSNLYLKGILEELHEKSKEYPELDYNENLFKKNILWIFKFVSSREREYFENLNFEDKEVKELLSNTGLDLPQIIGRQRDKSNPFKNDIVLFYKTKRNGENELSEEKFKELQEKRKRETDILLKEFSNMSTEGQSSYVQKLKSDIEVSQYSRDFVSISKNTNLPVYNYLIEISNERAWDVSRKDYQDQISVIKSLEETGYIVSEFESKEDRIVSDFLSNHFYKTGIFKEQMRMYCEFCDIYKDNQDIMSSLDHKIKDSKFKGYYTFYGTSGCSSRDFEEKKLISGFKDYMKGDKLVRDSSLY